MEEFLTGVSQHVLVYMDKQLYINKVETSMNLTSGSPCKRTIEIYEVHPTVVNKALDLSKVPIDSIIYACNCHGVCNSHYECDKLCEPCKCVYFDLPKIEKSTFEPFNIYEGNLDFGIHIGTHEEYEIYRNTPQAMRFKGKFVNSFGKPNYLKFCESNTDDSDLYLFTINNVFHISTKKNAISYPLSAPILYAFIQMHGNNNEILVDKDVSHQDVWKVLDELDDYHFELI